LRPPASHAQIAAIEAQYGFPLHPQLRALLERHDGGPDLTSTDGIGTILPGRHYLNGTDFIVSQHEGVIVQRDSFAEYFPDWREGFTEEPLDAHADQWVPFAHTNDGGFLFIDHCPGPTYGHVYECYMGETDHWASDLTDLIEKITDALSSGTPFKHHEPESEEDHSGRRILNW
jgi:cell wall assembly regulator SMI1